MAFRAKFVLCFQFHYAVFFAYMKLREQETRNLMWISECVAQNQKARIHDGIVIIFWLYRIGLIVTYCIDRSTFGDDVEDELNFTIEGDYMEVFIIAWLHKLEMFSNAHFCLSVRNRPVITFNLIISVKFSNGSMVVWRPLSRTVGAVFAAHLLFRQFCYFSACRNLKSICSSMTLLTRIR